MNPQTSLQHDPSQGSSERPPPKLPRQDLFNGSREDYLKIGVPLYEASIKCDWKAAKVILDKRPDLVRCSITENGETALHIAASAKGPKKMDDFVRNLVDKMEKDDLELQNKQCSTALYLAAAAGNITTVTIMMEKNRDLLTIPDSRGLMPLYAAVLFGNYEVVKYLYKYSSLGVGVGVGVGVGGWTDKSRGWLLEKCIEADMFDVALQIVEEPVELASKRNALELLARKTDALNPRKYNFLWRMVIWVFMSVGLMKGGPERENKSLPLLRTIWKEIARKPKQEIDDILNGPPDEINEENKSAIGWSAQATRLQVLISEHVTKMDVENNNIGSGPSDSTNQHISVVVNESVRLQNLISRHLADMHDESQKIIRRSPDSISKDNKTPSGKEYQALELQKLISKHIVDMHNETYKIIKEIQNEDHLALKLRELIIKYIKNLRIETEKIISGHANDTYSSQVLFIAAELGNTNFLIELIRQYPDLIWNVNDNNQSIFHIAVKHRHEGIYNLLYEIGAMKDMITLIKDNHENNMLHLVGESAKQKSLQDVSGVALQMQQELLWFQEVEAMIPPSYREQKNKDNLTPHDLFTKEHKELVTLGEKWMKGTANQCMIVATLIATIVFAAAFTVPGGYNQNTGIPFFKSKATFMVFVVADAISLFSSTASILLFLSILTSRYAESDFLKSLPRKLYLGLVTLFLSIATMTLAFSVSFFVLYNKGLLWMPILIGAFGVTPVLLYLLLQYGLFFDVIRSTYRSKYLFTPKKHVLYYKNPMV